MAQAIVHTELGGPEVLRLVEIADPAPGAGEVLIEVEATGVNPIDAKLRSGLRPSPDAPGGRRVGEDGAGIVRAVGSGVDDLRPGDAVVFAATPGAYATAVVAAASAVFPRPGGVEAAVGASLGVPVGTAYQTLRSLGVRAGDTLLVHGGSGSVGQAVIQFAVLSGATVIATASPRRHDRLRKLGAIPVAYGVGLAERVRAAAPQGITCAIDIAGTAEAIDVSLAEVADRSRIATLVRGRDAAALGIRAFLGGSPAPLTAHELGLRREAVPVTLALLAAGRFEIEMGPSFPLAEAAQAHRALEAGVDGKITLTP